MTSHESIHFVTGRLAESALRPLVSRLAQEVPFDFTIQVMPITVAALMTPVWIARHLHVPPEATRVILPGHCQGDLTPLQAVTPIPIAFGPRDLHELPSYFGRSREPSDSYGEHDIEILAEINAAPLMERTELLAVARQLAKDGADLIDVGCLPGTTWSQIGDAIRALRDDGHRVSIDSWNEQEVAAAVAAGAELVLSVNSTNCRAATDWGCPVVVIPDDFATLGGLEESLDVLSRAGIAFRIDPVLEPIGVGFAASLQRYFTIRQRYPDAEMMMGIGNLTELTDVDSAGVNVLLLAVCQELGIRSVLTTQVINWARSAVRECDHARRLVYHAHRYRVVAKHLDPGLVMLRDPQVWQQGASVLQQLAHDIRDPNYRLFAEEGKLHLVAANLYLTDVNPYQLFAQLLAQQPRPMDPSHAFYLGYELSKAVTALTLGKQYRQDEALNWGLLTQPEHSGRSHAVRQSLSDDKNEARSRDG